MTHLISVKLSHDRVLSPEDRLPLPQPHGSAHLTLIVFRHLDDDRIRRFRINFRRVSVRFAQNVPGVFDDGALKTYKIVKFG